MNIFVPNLNVCTTGKDLKGMFLEFGYVTSLKIIIAGETIWQHGSAFINSHSMLKAKPHCLV